MKFKCHIGWHNWSMWSQCEISEWTTYKYGISISTDTHPTPRTIKNKAIAMKSCIVFLLLLNSLYFASAQLEQPYSDAEVIISKKKLYGRQKFKAFLDINALARVVAKSELEAIQRWPKEASLEKLPLIDPIVQTAPKQTPPPRDYANEPKVAFRSGVTQEFMAWATQPKNAARTK